MLCDNFAYGEHFLVHCNLTLALSQRTHAPGYYNDTKVQVNLTYPNVTRTVVTEHTQLCHEYSRYGNGEKQQTIRCEWLGNGTTEISVLHEDSTKTVLLYGNETFLIDGCQPRELLLVVGEQTLPAVLCANLSHFNASLEITSASQTVNGAFIFTSV